MAKSSTGSPGCRIRRYRRPCSYCDREPLYTAGPSVIEAVIIALLKQGEHTIAMVLRVRSFVDGSGPQRNSERNIFATAAPANRPILLGIAGRNFRVD